ncbi:hypothetical protein L0156_28100 [bacterium]|nr:hypothetical protein [bacterium]
MANLFGFLKKRRQRGSIRERVQALASLLQRGSSASDYEQGLRLITDIQSFEAQGFGNWEYGYLTERLRGTPRIETPEWLVYSLVTESGFDNTEFISAIARRYKSKLWWWLKIYADDTRQDQQLREFAGDYLLPSCSFCGALRVMTATCERCGRPVNQS